MGGFPAPSHEDRSRPLMLLGTAFLLIGGLLFAAKLRGEEAPESGTKDRPGASVPRGNYQPAPMLPNTPITSQPGGSPINDTPDVTIIQDVRDTMRRLPLDRNNPKGWTNPKPKKPG